MDITIATETMDVVSLIVSVVIPLLVLLVGAAVTALAGAGAWAAVQRLAGEVRGLVDEPDDVVIITLDSLGEFVLHRELDAAIISRVMTAVADAIAKPPAEVGTGDLA